MIVIQVDSAATRRELGNLSARVVRPRAVLQAASRAARREMQRHFKDRNSKPNRLGGRRTHFWLDVLRSTQLGPITDAEGGVLVGDRRFAQKVYGGTLTAKRTKYLTIPVTPEAHGRRAEVLEREQGIQLFFLKRSSGGLLVERLADGKGVKVHYVLKPSVTQEADPEAMPPRAQLERVVRAAAEAQVDLMIRRASNPQGGSNA